MPFQSRVNRELPLAVEGDFASSNPRSTVIAPAGGFVAGVGGVTVGKFAWIESDGVTVVNHGTAPNAPSGFVHRDQQGLITAYLGEASMLVPEGFPVTLHNQGDFFARVTGSVDATRGTTVYADYSDGSVTITSAATGASATGSLGSTVTASIGSTSTGTGSGTNLTLSSLTGYVSIGDKVSGTGVPAGTTIVSQTSGTTGLAGVYVTSQATTASSATITTFGTVLNVTAVGGGYVAIGDEISAVTDAVIVSQSTGSAGSTGLYVIDTAASAYVASGTVTTYGDTVNVTAVASGTLEVGQPITGTGVPASSVIDAQLSGTAGGIGLYSVSNRASAYAASTTLTTTGGVATSFKAASDVAVGELVKITTWS